MIRAIAYSVVGLLIGGSVAQAQFLPRGGSSTGGAGTPGGSPSIGGIGSAPSSGGFSPYLNLTRGGNSAAVNYYGIVRPQMSFQNSIQSLQQQQQFGSSNSSEPYDPTQPSLILGTRARFLNTSGYFLNLNGSTVSGGSGSRIGQSGQGTGVGQGQLGSGSGGGVSSALSTGAGVFLGGSGARSGNRGGRR